MSTEIKTPYDDEIEIFERRYNYPFASQDVLKNARAKREGYLAGYAAGDQAHSCDDAGCPCYQRGREAEAEEPSSTGATI